MGAGGFCRVSPQDLCEGISAIRKPAQSPVNAAADSDAVSDARTQGVRLAAPESVEEMRARRVDRNHGEVVAALRKIGCEVMDLSRVGNGCADLIACLGFRIRLLEIKDGSKPPSARKLTPAQKVWHESWRRHVDVVESPEQAIEVMTR